MSLAIWIGIVFCVTQSAMFSGLNLAFFSLTRLRLEIEVAGGSQAALRVLNMRRDSNFLLTTILWGNVVVGDNCMISDSIIMGGPVTIPDGMNLEKSIVTPLVHGKIPATIKILQEQGMMVWPLRQ